MIRAVALALAMLVPALTGVASAEPTIQFGQPGSEAPPVSVGPGWDGDDGAELPRMYKSRRTMTVPNAPKEFVISSALLGTRLSATLISSSTDEKATDTNHALFGIAVMLLIGTGAKQ